MTSRNTSAGITSGGSGGAGSDVDKMMSSFQAPDSILEHKIFDSIALYLGEGGQPLMLVNALSTSYVGMPEMCNLMSGWAREFDIDPVDVMQEVLKEQLMERFDPESVDRDFMNGTGTPDWLMVMIQHPFWRSVIYELSEKHQKCSLLNFAIQRISDAGYQGEIASVATASTFVNVFSGVLLDSLDKLREEDDVGLLDRLPDLIIMLSSIFVPSFKGAIVKQDHKEKYLYLVAYAASVHEENDKITDTSDVQSTYEALCALEDTLSKRTAGTDLTPILGQLLVAIEHPLQQTAVFATLVDFFEAPLELNPEIMMTYRKSILDRMIYLMQLNYVMPVLDYIRVRARKMDQSLSMHFVKKVLEMVRGPYSKKFIEGMGQMIEEIVEVIKKTDTELVVRAWIDEVVLQSGDSETHTPPASLPPSTSSSTAHEAGAGALSLDAGQSTIQELKRRLDEPRR
ncbi:Negative elongation factor C/D [Dissophora globulifera]|nr:Negative elongation factor C/D [Dissophora globulifera]